MLVNENNIGYIEMVLRLKKPGKDILASLTAEKCDLLHMAIGITDEMRELTEAYETYLNCDYLDSPSKEHLVEELGDTLFYMTGFSDAMFNICDTWCQNNTGERRFDLLDLVKKHVIYNKPIDLIAVTDCFKTYCGLIEECARRSGISLEDVIEHNMRKLDKRYGKTYTDEAAQARRDKAEGE